MSKRLVSWNIKEGNEDENVHDGLEFLKSRVTGMPAIIGLQEAKNYGQPLDGYVRIQHDSVSYGSRPETANIALYVRKDLYPRVTKILSARMKKTWRGPMAGIKHDPRVYRGVVLDGVTYWCVHVPVGDADAARTETWAWMRRQIWKPGKVVIFGDMNIHPRGGGISKVLRRAWGRVKYWYNHVDGFLVKNNLKGNDFLIYGKRYGSDHHPVSIEVK